MKLKAGILVLTLLSACLINLSARPLSEKDSLLNVYQGSAQRDTSYVKMLNRLSQIYRLSVPDSALIFGNEAYELAEKISYKKGIANSLNIIGTCYFYKGDYPAAQTYQQKALAYAQENHLAAPYANALNSLALAYQYQGNYISALDAYLKALHAEEESKNYPGQVKVLCNIGILYKNQEEFDNATLYYNRALAMTDSLKDPRSLQANTYNNLGIIFIEQKKFREALDYLWKSVRLHEALGSKIYVASSYGNIGYCYLEMDSIPLAEKYIKMGLALSSAINYQDNMALARVNLAEVYLRQNKANLALPLAKESLTLALRSNNKENVLLSYKALAVTYKKLGQASEGYNFLEKALMLDDSLKNSSNTRKIANLQKAYELNKKESEIALLEKDAELKKVTLEEERSIRYGLIGLVAGLAILVGVIYYSFSRQALLSKELKRQNEEISLQKELIERINKDLRAKALRAQMNPHFIFNSLNSIQYLILKNESTKAFDYLAKFALLLRKVMDNSEQNLISLSEEIEILTLYLELESLRFDGSFDYKIESSVENMKAARIPPLVLQPYVENAIQHGLMPKSFDRRLNVTFSQQSDAICCEITDNGIGREEAQEISKRRNRIFASKGMNYTAERIEVMNRIFSGKSEVNITDLAVDGKAAGTRVKILFAYA